MVTKKSNIASTGYLDKFIDDLPDNIEDYSPGRGHKTVFAMDIYNTLKKAPSNKGIKIPIADFIKHSKSDNVKKTMDYFNIILQKKYKIKRIKWAVLNDVVHIWSNSL